MGGLVFFINLEHGWVLSAIAGLKQGFYTFFFGGIIVKLLEFSLMKIKNSYLSIPVSVFAISILASLLVYMVHSTKGTPEPFLSTIPTLLMAPPGFLILALRFKREKTKNKIL